MRAIVFVLRGASVDGVLRMALLSREWEVLCATGEDELIALVRGTRPELVILPAADASTALEAARRIRASDRRVPIVLSAFSCSGDLALAAMRSGVNDVVTERCTEDEIAPMLDRLAAPAPPASRAKPLLSAERLVGWRITARSSICGTCATPGSSTPERSSIQKVGARRFRRRRSRGSGSKPTASPQPRLQVRRDIRVKRGAPALTHHSRQA